MAHEKDQFLKLFLANQASLYTFVIARGIAPASADDVVQNVASVLWRKFESFELGTNFKAWAFSIAQFEMLRFRDKHKESSLFLHLNEDTLAFLESPAIEEHDDYIEYKKDVLRLCLNRLGDDARKIIEMRYGDNHSFDELAQVLKKSSGALRVKVSRIRAALQKCVATQASGVKI